ncbi:flagellar motor switch protein G [Thioalkalivibrio sulfidiphilus HL-EbGr7]|uniref:Flagellar motor switch protein FliG n=1 Tax=Thioalkalivibrio sulfidiphilus (strain HL-EbGR7) TaxID=396588 RepID=B8GT34_THISH|nr:flagellar motor switch protein FliG [Thioalkalivibrio sulfidiphilus]ACL73049.1 flagellar motor switch protein G [Thioalkalivibrio sulfidiphilus HL-EbGr7]
MAQGPENSKFTGTERAAVFLMSLGEDAAAEVLKHMGPKEVQRLGTAMATLANVSRTEVQKVLEEFTQAVEEQTALGVGTDEYIRKVLTSALGEDKAGGLINRILLGRNSKGLEALKWMEPRAVAEVIRLEHPQIISIVLSYLDPDHAAEVLSFLPERTQPDILMRIASLDGIQPNALQELDEILERQFSGNSNVKSSAVGGIKSAANILNFMEPSKEATIVDRIREVDEDLSQQIQDLMFVFDNLVEVDDRGIQALLREISTESLVLALKGAEDALKEKIFKNMSKRAAEMLRDDLEAKGPVRLSEVEGAQKEILTVARRMAESGEIVLGGKGGDEFV